MLIFLSEAPVLLFQVVSVCVCVCVRACVRVWVGGWVGVGVGAGESQARPRNHAFKLESKFGPHG